MDVPIHIMHHTIIMWTILENMGGGANILKVPRVGAQKHFEFSYLKYACQIGVNHKHLRVDNKKIHEFRAGVEGYCHRIFHPPLPVVIVDNFLCTISSNT